MSSMYRVATRSPPAHHTIDKSQWLFTSETIVLKLWFSALLNAVNRFGESIRMYREVI
uniref:Uncharacterized protein n=1 Tax=Arion vulgaris TaxID=1028688 RepID=A0A0B6YNJ2_9EUPU